MIITEYSDVAYDGCIDIFKAHAFTTTDAKLAQQYILFYSTTSAS
jgi:hypothetical protein